MCIYYIYILYDYSIPLMYNVIFGTCLNKTGEHLAGWADLAYVTSFRLVETKGKKQVTRHKPGTTTECGVSTLLLACGSSTYNTTSWVDLQANDRLRKEIPWNS